MNSKELYTNVIAEMKRQSKEVPVETPEGMQVTLELETIDDDGAYSYSSRKILITSTGIKYPDGAILSPKRLHEMFVDQDYFHVDVFVAELVAQVKNTPYL